MGKSPKKGIENGKNTIDFRKIGIIGNTAYLHHKPIPYFITSGNILHHEDNNIVIQLKEITYDITIIKYENENITKPNKGVQENGSH